MISEVWVKSIKSNRDQSARQICQSLTSHHNLWDQSLWAAPASFLGGKKPSLSPCFTKYIWTWQWDRVWSSNLGPALQICLQELGKTKCCAVAWIRSWCRFRCWWRMDPTANWKCSGHRFPYEPLLCVKSRALYCIYTYVDMESACMCIARRIVRHLERNDSNCTGLQSFMVVLQALPLSALN